MSAIALDAILQHFIATGRLALRLPDGTLRSYAGRPGPSAGMAIRTRRGARRLVLNPGLGFGEAYMDGDLEPMGCSLYELLDLLMLNTMEGSPHPTMKLFERARFGVRRVLQHNEALRSRRNVAHHYDLNGRLYEMFLDADRQYSCAYFPRGDETLEEAQVAKKRHIASKLLLDRPDMTVLDIGCGWGGMALTLARDYGARVLGITLSTEQLHTARARAEAAGLADRVQFALQDYRAIDGQFDRIVSVGMFEHVGIGHFGSFFATVKRCLLPNGVALLHAIGRNDGPGATSPWIAKYIFPGGYSPAVSEVFASIERSGLWVTDCEILRLHYAKTIAHWRERFAVRREDIRALYDERFCRMFELYLAGAELAFLRQGHMNFQIQLSPSLDAVPLTRDYMIEDERRRAERETARQDNDVRRTA